MTPGLEKGIEKVAKKLAGFSPLQEVDDEERYYQSHKCNTYDACLKIAKSDAVKTYWQKGMYTEEEVETLFKNWLNTKINEELMRISGELGYFEGVTFGDWFEQNKKK